MSEADELFEMSIPEPNSGCWIWRGPDKGNGYGRFKRGSAHRASYEAFVGQIPQGLHLDHLCRNPMCINPGHLEPVTPKENVLRGFGVTALNARKTECKYGHPFTPENTIIKKFGKACRICQRIMDRDNKRRQRKRAKDAFLDANGGGNVG